MRAQSANLKANTMMNRHIYIHISAAEALTIVRPYTRIAYLGRVPKAELTFNQPQLLPACLNYLLNSWSSRNEI